MNLKEYEQEKFGIGDIIRSAQAVINNDEFLQPECRDLLERLAEVVARKQRARRANVLHMGRSRRKDYWGTPVVVPPLR